MTSVQVERNRPSLRAKECTSSTVVFVSAGMNLSGRYELVREIARGGMGIVFEAVDRQLEDLPIAVKVLPPELATSARSKKRLRKEAIASMKLSHPNIVRLFGFEEDGATSFLKMEYVNGKSLDDALAETDDETLPLDEVMQIARDVCPALDYAHSAGIIHRDIKPANLMYHIDGETKSVKIADFGIACTVKDSMTRLTGVESAGTLLYISPEQLRGGRPQAQSDQYSLAATLYELLSGDPPFVGGGLSHQVINAKPKAIDGVPEVVNSALLRALAKKPEDRFENCSALLAALEGKETTKTVVGSEKVLKSAVDKNWMAGAAIVSCLFLGAFMSSFAFEDSPPREITRQPVVESVKEVAKPVKKVVPEIKKVKPVIVVPRKATVAIDSNPLGAKVFCFELPNRYLGKTPLRKTLTAGEYTLKFVRPGFETVTKRVYVKAGADLTVAAELKSLQGQLALDLNPAEAKLYVDGRYVSRQERQELKLNAGLHKLEARLAGYKTKQCNVNIIAGKSISGTINLERLKAILRLSKYPSDASITINGYSVSVNSYGFTEFEKEPGFYTVVAKRAGYKTLTKEVHLQAGDNEQLCLNLEEVAARPVVLQLALRRMRSEKVTQIYSIDVDGERLTDFSLEKDHWYNRADGVRERIYRVRATLKPGEHLVTINGEIEDGSFLSSVAQDFTTKGTVDVKAGSSLYTVDMGFVGIDEDQVADSSAANTNTSTSLSSKEEAILELIPLLMRKRRK